MTISIYLEKLKVLQDDLSSIKKGTSNTLFDQRTKKKTETHKEIVKQDKKLDKKREKEIKAASDMYEFQLQSIDNLVEHEKSMILLDIEVI